MRSKLQIAMAAATAIALAFIGLSAANGREDEGESLEKIMENVNKQNNIIRGAVRSVTNYKKGSENAHKASEMLVELGKKARANKTAAEKQKKEIKEWTDAMDKFIKASENLVELTKAGSEQPAAKKAFSEVTKSCADCHTVFRVDEDEFGSK